MRFRVKKRKILVPQPKSKFLLVTCPDCGNKQVTFSHATIEVKCNMCGRILLKPTGGKAELLVKEFKELS